MSGKSACGSGLLDEGFDDVHDLLLLPTRKRGYRVEDLADAAGRPALASGLDAEKFIGGDVEDRRQLDQRIGPQSFRFAFPCGNDLLRDFHLRGNVALRQTGALLRVEFRRAQPLLRLRVQRPQP